MDMNADNDWAWLEDAFARAQAGAQKVLDAAKVHPDFCPTVEQEAAMRKHIAAMPALCDQITGKNKVPLLVEDPLEPLEVIFEMNGDLGVMSQGQAAAVMAVINLLSVIMMSAAIHEQQQQEPEPPATGLIVPGR